MRKNFGRQTWLYPLPVLIIGSYDENGNPNAMNAAWGGVYASNKIMLCISSSHKTTKNIMASGAFTVSYADVNHVKEADYVGIATGNRVEDKLAIAGFTTTKSEFVNAPIINELPVTAECRLAEINTDGIVIGEIINISADESVLGEDGQIDAGKLQPISFDPVRSEYRVLGEKVGRAFHDGQDCLFS